jgi:23S rRNA pseudouridine1911/1915/1917 synthase
MALHSFKNHSGSLAVKKEVLPMKSFNTYTIAPEFGGFTVECYLKQVLQYSGRKIQRLTRQKGIQLNGRPVFLQKKVKPQDVLRILIAAETSYGVEPEAGTIKIVYEDDFLLVLNKQPFQLVHPTGRTTGNTLANFLAFHFRQQGVVNTIRPVHRLDRDTSGCVIFAKDAHTQTLLEEQIKSRTLKRTYWAIVNGLVSSPCGTIDAPIGAHPSMPNRRIICSKGEPAITHYRTLRHFQNTTLLELNLDTGRTHQIRLHLSHLGYPVVGDKMYGTRSPRINRQALHAYSVSFCHVGIGEQRQLTVQAPLPDDFVRLLELCAK